MKQWDACQTHVKSSISVLSVDLTGILSTKVVPSHCKKREAQGKDFLGSAVALHLV